jgi:DNA-binding transcriptional regulator YhcF (GntR family)
MPVAEIDFSRFTLRRDLPPHRQVAAYFKALIALGQLNVGDPVPTVSAVSYRLKIRAAEVRRAYAELAERGFLSPHGTKWRVSDDYRPVEDLSLAADICGRLWDLIVEARKVGLSRAEIQRMFESLLDRP